MTVLDFLRRRHPIPAPKCKQCGHEPCPICETWCDMMVRSIWCPHCEAMIASDFTWKNANIKQMSCPSCKKSFKVTAEQEDLDTCCEGHCDFDASEKDVSAWCAQERAR